MPKASEIAAELRRVADRFDEQPDIEVKRPELSFFHWSEKQNFLNAVKIMPRPLTKREGGGSFPSLYLDYTTDALIVEASVQKSTICKLIKPAVPAKYRCEPILSAIEEASLESQAAPTLSAIDGDSILSF
jgi:hypothetical protein